MMGSKAIEDGFEVFASGYEKPFGAVRETATEARQLIVYIENAGDFTVPLEAVTAVHAQKVIVDTERLSHALRRAIHHAHDREDPRL